MRLYRLEVFPADGPRAAYAATRPGRAARIARVQPRTLYNVPPGKTRVFPACPPSRPHAVAVTPTEVKNAY